MNLFDRALKVLAFHYAEAFLRLAFPDKAVQLVGMEANVELALIEKRVDFVHRVRCNGQEYVFHLEFQLEHRTDLPKRLFIYSAMLTDKYDLPVVTLVLYLERRVSDTPTEYAEPDERKRGDLLATAIAVASRYFGRDLVLRFFEKEVEQMRHGSIIEDWIAEGVERGRQQGRQEGRRQEVESVLTRVLARRFGRLPTRLPEKLQPLTLEQVEELIDHAVVAQDLAAFEQVLAQFNA